jgi:glucoamylase
MRYRGDRIAFGAPGIDPRWEHGDKSGVGSAYSGDSKLWYTLWRGIVTEVYYPIIDHPQLRDLQFLVTDGRSFFHEERRHLDFEITRPDPIAPGYRVVSTDPDRRYRIEKEVLSHPHAPVLLERVKTVRLSGYVGPLQLYTLAAPHLDVGGQHNNGYVVEVGGREYLVAEHNDFWLALGASEPFQQLSCGYVGASDGWTDLSQNFEMDWEFDRAPDGNIALTGRLPDAGIGEFTLGLSFGRGLADAVTQLMQALGTPYERLRSRFRAQWARSGAGLDRLTALSGDGGHLYRSSHTTILVHEDKSFPGAFIASLAIPWGHSRNDTDRGAYHLVWTRDLCQIAGGLLAAGNTETPLRTLIYLAASQSSDGSFPQNFWLNGNPYWGGVQLDEVSFPILLAHRLRHHDALASFDPYPMIRAGARFLVEYGPATGQDRWEEASGYSPSTLAVHISALLVAAEFARGRKDEPTATFLEENADFLERKIEPWTVTESGTLLAGHPRHYIRILPVDPADPQPTEDPDAAFLNLANQAPGSPVRFPARDIVDAGFLELVRHGVRPANDPAVLDSIAVVDHVLRVETPLGPCWRRYNHDGYGQRDDGDPFANWGVGRAWPLLTGERGHYELAAGHDVGPYLRALERFASPTGLLSEQLWDRPSEPDKHLELGRPTGAAMPLLWAHAEYLKLLRSAADGRVFDRVPEVEARYVRDGGKRGPPIEIWKFRRQPRAVRAGTRLRVQASQPFRLHWSVRGWEAPQDSESISIPLGIFYVDLDLPKEAPGPIEFTFFWPQRDAWEGRDYRVEVLPPEPALALGVRPVRAAR